MFTKKIEITILVLIATLMACGTLRIRDFPEQFSADKDAVVTSKNSYNRNTTGLVEIDPPLHEEWSEEYTSLPNNGFTAVDNWLLFGTYNGYFAVADVEDGDLKGKRNLGDACANPPTIQDKTVYLSYETGSYGLIAYDLYGGYVKWELEDHFSRSSPIIIGDHVLFQTINGEVLCLQAEDGVEIWRISLQTEIRNSAAYASGKLVIATLEGKILAISPDSGEVIWEVGIKTPIMADPVINEERLYIVSHTGILIIFDLNDGTELSRQKSGTRMYHGPTVDARNIYLATGDGRLLSLDKNNFDQNWVFKGEGPAAGSALITNSYAYFTTLAGNLYILDKKTGKILQQIELSGRARSTPIIRKGKLIVSVENKQVIAYARE